MAHVPETTERSRALGLAVTVLLSLAALLVLAGAPSEAAAQESCARCLARGAAATTCEACPPEIRAILDGKPRVTRRSADLANDCLALEPIHPMLLPGSHRRLSKPLDHAELENARTFGYRRVRVLPGCAGTVRAVPEHVLLARPLSPQERLRDDGAPKPIVRVDRSHPGCVSGAGAGRLSPSGPPACDVRTALAATRRDGGTVIEIAGGVYPEPLRMPMGHGQVLVARDDEPVTLSGWIDLSRGTGPGRPWVKAWDDPTGVVWVLDWSDHRSTGGSAANRVSLELDERELTMARHFTPDTIASDVDEIAFTREPVGAPGAPALFFFANPDHGATCMHSGINVKSREVPCDHDGQRLSWGRCLELGIPIQPRIDRDGVCQARPGACTPVFNWRTGKHAGREACRRVLGEGVRQCLLLKLPRGSAPSDHSLRSAHTDHGLHLRQQEKRPASGLVIRGLRLEKVPVTAGGLARGAAPAGPTLRLDALELADSPVALLGSHMVLENSHGEKGSVLVSGGEERLSEVILRNNVLDRYYGKAVSWGESPRALRAPLASRSPERLHRLAPLCEGQACAGPESPVLFSGRESFATWPGWNKVLFNLIRSGSAINFFGHVSHTVIAGNAFEHSGIQEGIADLSSGVSHVLVHHNWSTDGAGTGIVVSSSVEDLVVSDNQFHRSPGSIDEGAGTDRSPADCAMHQRPCDGAHRSILFQPRDAACREVTFENNLSAGSHHGGLAFQACDRLTVRNNTAAGSHRLAELTFMASAAPREPARFLDNVASDPARTEGEVVRYSERSPHAFRVSESRGNFIQGCQPGGAGCPVAVGVPIVTTDPAWRSAPRYADPEAGDFRLIGGWSGPDPCGASPGARYAHPGFNYADELCAARSGGE